MWREWRTDAGGEAGIWRRAHSLDFSSHAWLELLPLEGLIRRLLAGKIGGTAAASAPASAPTPPCRGQSPPASYLSCYLCSTILPSSRAWRSCGSV